jgi:type IV pilus assembly protein PilA
MKNKRLNDKGFSLVELIVVIAIMAILAVTLAPKLTQYINKARTASDKKL